MQLVGILKRAGMGFLDDRAMAQSAAVAFFTALSFAPLVLLLITIGGFLGDSAQNDLIRFFENQLGPSAAEVTQTVAETAEKNQQDRAWWRWVVSIGVLLFSASVVFAQLQAALNFVWGVKAKPGQGIWGFIRKRLLSMGMIFAVLFILLVALVVSAVLDQFFSADAEILSRALSVLVSLLVFTLLFAAIFKFLPDVEVPWKDIWIGALITAILFSVGKLLLGLYFQYSNVGQGYGQAAGSLIAMLFWVYYSCIIFFFGAEITQQYAAARGAGIKPDEHAQPLRTPKTEN